MRNLPQSKRMRKFRKMTKPRGKRLRSVPLTDVASRWRVV